MTNSKIELIENGDGDINLGRYLDVEFVIGEMIISRSDSAEQVAERTAELVKMLRPEDAFVVFQEATLYAKARLDDIRCGDHSCLATYDALLNGLEP
jgi:hypothetical protein